MEDMSNHHPQEASMTNKALSFALAVVLSANMLAAPLAQAGPESDASAAQTAGVACLCSHTCVYSPELAYSSDLVTFLRTLFGVPVQDCQSKKEFLFDILLLASVPPSTR